MYNDIYDKCWTLGALLHYLYVVEYILLSPHSTLHVVTIQAYSIR